MSWGVIQVEIKLAGPYHVTTTPHRVCALKIHVSMCISDGVLFAQCTLTEKCWAKSGLDGVEISRTGRELIVSDSGPV